MNMMLQPGEKNCQTSQVHQLLYIYIYAIPILVMILVHGVCILNK